MNEFLLIKFIHTVGFAYWLGGDLGVFYSSYFVTNDKLSVETRMATAKILFALDQAPRICMTMMLPLGMHLGWKMGLLPFGAVTMGAIWIICFAWLAMVVTLHAMAQSKGKVVLTTIDFWFRLLLSLALIGIGFRALYAGYWPAWFAIKLAIFGGLIGSGLIVRIKLKPFGPAFAAMAQSGEANAETNAAIRTSLNSTRPFVITIWIGLLASTALGLHLI